MRIAIVGGIFGKDESYRSVIENTPETVLADGLESRGHYVERVGHDDRLPDDVDLLHIHHFGSAVVRFRLTRGSRPPMVFTAHGSAHDWGSRKRILLGIGSAEAVVALSPIEAQNPVYRSAKTLRVVPNGVDSELFRPLPMRPPREHGSALRLLYVGQRSRAKGYDVLLKSLENLDVILTSVYHVTPGPDQKYLDHLVGLPGVRGKVQELGPRKSPEVADLMRVNDALVLPSMHESLPSVITEALLSALPVISSDLVGPRWQLGGCGLLVQPGNLQSLVSAIIQMNDGLERHQQDSDSRRQVAVDLYSREAMLDAHEELYSELLVGHLPGVPRHRDVLIDACGVKAIERLRRLRSRNVYREQRK